MIARRPLLLAWTALLLLACGGSQKQAPIVSVPQPGLAPPVIDTRPAQAEALVRGALLQAEAAAAAGDHAAARRDLERARSMAPLDARVHFGLGLLHKLEDEPEQATQAFEAAARLAPFHWPVWTELALLALQAGDLETAAVRLNAAEALAPGLPQVLWVRARIALAAGDAPLAVERLEAVVAFEEAPAAAWVDLGDARRAAADPEGAAEAYHAALALDPEAQDALAGLEALGEAAEP